MALYKLDYYYYFYFYAHQRKAAGMKSKQLSSSSSSSSSSSLTHTAALEGERDNQTNRDSKTEIEKYFVGLYCDEGSESAGACVHYWARRLGFDCCSESRLTRDWYPTFEQRSSLDATDGDRSARRPFRSPTGASRGAV